MIDITLIYFSGTGNTRYVAKKMFSGLNAEIKRLYSIEEDVDFARVIGDSRDIMLFYPIIGGGIPRIMRDFLTKYNSAFWGKGLYTVVTEAGFSGDGGALAYRYLASDHVTFKGSEHIYAPTNVSIGKIVRVSNDIDGKVARMDRRISRLVTRINAGNPPHRGISRLSYLLGYHLQRKHFERMEGDMATKFHVDSAKCVQCKKCISLCPMHNISLLDGNIVGKGECTLCYRCVHACPTNAIEILHREDVQYRGIADER